MKTILSLFTTLALVSCAGINIKQYETPANARIATSLICTNVINFAIAPADRADVARDLYAAASVFNQFSAGHIPTPEELRAAIQLVTPNHADEWITLTTNICGIWSAIYPSIQGNSALALQYLQSISMGCQDAASSFLPHR
jgi:hypothetical protein